VLDILIDRSFFLEDFSIFHIAGGAQLVGDQAQQIFNLLAPIFDSILNDTIVWDWSRHWFSDQWKEVSDENAKKLKYAFPGAYPLDGYSIYPCWNPKNERTWLVQN